jgi:hypothetical protein
MALPLKQFFAAYTLRVATILDLEPCSPSLLRRIRPKTVLGHNALKIHFCTRAETTPYRIAQRGQRIAVWTYTQRVAV